MTSAGGTPSADPLQAAAGDVDWVEPEGRRRRSGRVEVWVQFAYLLTLLTVAHVLYLSMRNEGRLPIYTFWFGSGVLTVAALLTLLVGSVRSLLFRPFMRRSRLQGIFCIALVLVAVNYPYPFPAAREGQPSAVRFQLPVRGEWVVVWGGEDPEDNVLAIQRPDRRWGLELVQVDDEGSTHVRPGTKLTEYHAFDAVVFAPADGEVVAARSDMRDNPPDARRVVDEEFGNHVVIRVAEGEYVFLSHLKEGSVLVEAGDTVRAGQELGRVGNSGFSTTTPEPHLALHLQDTAEPRFGQAVPWYFHDYRVGNARIERGLPRGGRGSTGELIGERIESDL